MTSKILFTDADDTLLTNDKRVTEENAAAIEEALRQGHRIVVTTGRSLAAARPLAAQLGLDRPGCYIIVFNGGQIWDYSENRTIFRSTVPAEDALHLSAEAKKQGIHCQIYDDEYVYSTEDNDSVRRYCSLQGIPYRIVPEFSAELCGESVKLLFVDYNDRPKLDRFRDQMQEWAGDRLSFFFSNSWYLECVKAGISKGFGVHFLADRLGVPISDTIAVGDSENDIPMIREAGIGFAVKNATEAVRAAADHVTERDCNNSAVAEIIGRYMLS